MHVLDLARVYDGDLNKYNFADASFIYSLSQDIIKKQFLIDELDYHEPQNKEIFLFAYSVTVNLLNELAIKNKRINLTELDKTKQAVNNAKRQALSEPIKVLNKLEVLA